MGYELRYRKWLRSQSSQAQADLAELDRRADAQATLGYVTSDDLGKDGDDTVVSSCVAYPIRVFLTRHLACDAALCHSFGPTARLHLVSSHRQLHRRNARHLG